jgi:ABC-type transport system involved in multi-copper enzyme maturation permease subunit
MKTILLIAADGIRGLIHQRLLLGLMLASLAMTIVFSVFLNSVRQNVTESFSEDRIASDSFKGSEKMSEADRRKLREQMGNMSSVFQAGFYAVASFGGKIVALFIFSTAVASEIRRGTIRLTLSKPVSRTQFLLGKYLGGVAVMGSYALIAGAAIVVFAQSQSLDLNPAIKWSPWLMFCEQLMLGSVALLLSLFMHPIVASVLAFFAGNGFYASPNPLYFILPSYSDFGVFMEVLQGTLVDWKEVALLSLYAFDFVAIMLLLALWRFRTKELL